MGAMGTRQGYGYLRVSGKTQLHGDGFERQREEILQAAEREGIEVVGWFEERISGTREWDERPAWVEMILECQTSDVKYVLIEKLDRSARDLMVQEHIIVDLKRRGIELVSAKEPDLGSNDPTRVLMRQIMGAIAQYDKTMLVLKLRAARDRKRRITGKKVGGARYYGEESAEEQKIVDWMVRVRAMGESYTDIALYLEQKGVVPPQMWKRRGSLKWHSGTVKRILDRAQEGQGLGAAA